MMSRTTERYLPHQKHPELFQPDFREEWLHPDAIKLVKAFEDSQSTDDPTKISPYLRVEVEDVYSFNCLNMTFVQMFNEEIQNFYEMAEKHNIPIRRPNSMNNYGVIVNEIGMRPMITCLQQKYIWPLARRLFPEPGSKFHTHHSFIVRYQANEDLGLDMHTDDSDVTFNVCLGHEFTGATLSFCGYIGKPNHRKQTHTYHHEVGRAVLHLGTRRHGADDIATGSRANLIVWNHNQDWRMAGGNQAHQLHYEKEAGPPDLVCLSYTHDRDFLFYKDLPESKKDEHFHGWCPPRTKEYDGFQKKMLEKLPRDDL